MMDERFAAMLTPPKLTDIRRALFIQPHPDDNEIGAGGTMAYLVSLGAEVYGLTVTDDRYSSATVWGEDAVTMRQQEALRAMETLGVVNAGFLGFHDKTEAGEEELRRAIIPVIRRIKPDAVFSCDPTLENESHSDHIRVGRAVMYSVLDAGCAFYPELDDGLLRSDAHSVAILGQYYTDKPNTTMDITPFFKKKLQAIRCHASQVDEEFMQMMVALHIIQAQGAGFTYAEKLKLLSARHLHCFTLPIS